VILETISPKKIGEKWKISTQMLFMQAEKDKNSEFEKNNFFL
jgi:hypothetical protein